MSQLFANNADSILSSVIAQGDTTITVLSGSRFPSPSGGDYFLLTLAGLDANGNETSWEIVKVTARDGNDLTVVRAQEGTTATTWPSSTRAELRLTAGSFLSPGGALSTPTSGNLSNCTADGDNPVGAKNIPQNLQGSAYTCVLGDAGKHIYETGNGAIAIPANTSVVYTIGTAITIIAGSSAVSISCGDTIRLAGGTSTGTRTLAAYGIATAIKIAATEWRISGVGLS